MIIDIHKSKKDLQLLYKVSYAVNQSFDLQHIYKSALDIAINLQDIDMAFIYLASKDRKEAVLQSHRNLTKDYICRARKISYPEGVTWKVLNSGKVFIVNDIQQDNDIYPAGKDIGHRRALCIPITLEGIVMGVIWLASYEKGKFSKQEIELNTSIGNQIGVAIARAKLHEEMEARVRDCSAKLEKANLRLKNEIENRKSIENEVRIVREQYELLNAIKQILKEEVTSTPSLAEKLAIDIEVETGSNFTHTVLSKREYQVMTMLASGMCIKEVAKKIYLSASTISTYRTRILEKLNLKTTAELIRYAIKNNLVD